MGDWRNPDAYPLPNELEPWEWAWQFLRRNPEYQGDFQAVMDRFSLYEDDFSQLVAERNGPDFKPNSIPNVECRQKWYVEYYLNPEVEKPKIDPFLGFVDLYMSNTHLWPLQSHEALVRFDLRRPLTPQLKLARWALEPRQKNMVARGDIEFASPRNQERKWPLYLRLLDAHAAKASYEELDSVIPASPRSSDPNLESRVGAHLRQARRMYQEGYRDILLMSPGS